MNEKEELGYKLQHKVPLIIYPNETDYGRVISEGFIFKEGFFFLDFGWDNMMAGTGSDHVIKGSITGPFKGDSDRIVRYWKIGNSKICEITNLHNMFESCMYDVDRKTSDRRKIALKVANEIMREYRKGSMFKWNMKKLEKIY